MRLIKGFPRAAATAREFVSAASSVWADAMPTFASSRNTAGDDPRPVEECQCGPRIPNEDAVIVPQGGGRQAEGKQRT